MTSPARPLSCLALALLLTGCDEPKIAVYRAPKEKPASPAATHAHADAPVAPRSRPQLEWTLPDGWRQVEARVGVATFALSGEPGQEAQVNVTPLPPMSGREALIINMWRSQVGLAELGEDEAMKQLTPVEVGGESGRMFEVASAAPGGSGPQRIVTAMVHRADYSWFYKLAGDDALVTAQKPKFLEFLKSVRLKEGAASAPETAAAPAAPAAGFNWKVPAAWKAVAPGQMQVAKFAVPTQGAAKAEVAVSVFPGATGTTLENVNRWRGQIGLGPVDAAGLAKLVTPLDPGKADAILVDVTNNDRRLLGAILPRGSRYYFYKLMGDEAAVAPQKDAFIEFVKSEP